MRCFTFLSIATSAFAGLASATSGCNVTLESTISNPSDSGEVILYKTLIKWNNSTDISISSSEIDWANSAKAPYSLFFYEDDSAGLTLSVLESILEPWEGTYLAGGASPGGDSVQGDYLVTGVTCA